MRYPIVNLRSWSSFILFLGLVASSLAHAAPNEPAPPGRSSATFAVAVLDFEADGMEALRKNLPELLSAQLSAHPDVVLVERQRLELALSELELGLSGTVDPATAAAIGQLVGAKALVTGRLFHLGDELVGTARIIGTETSRVIVESVALPAGEPASQLAMSLGEKVAASLVSRRAELVGTAPADEDRMKRLAGMTRGVELPSVSIAIAERHEGRTTLDPAAQTELALILGQLGFRIVDARQSEVRPAVRITGEAISETGLRKGNLVSATGRVEIQVTEVASQTVLVADRRSERAIDLSPTIAGKTALQKASGALAERVVTALIANAKGAPPAHP